MNSSSVTSVHSSHTLSLPISPPISPRELARTHPRRDHQQTARISQWLLVPHHRPENRSTEALDHTNSHSILRSQASRRPMVCHKERYSMERRLCTTNSWRVHYSRRRIPLQEHPLDRRTTQVLSSAVQSKDPALQLLCNLLAGSPWPTPLSLPRHAAPGWLDDTVRAAGSRLGVRSVRRLL